jgi:hypothetical protein
MSNMLNILQVVGTISSSPPFSHRNPHPERLICKPRLSCPLKQLLSECSITLPNPFSSGQLTAELESRNIFSILNFVNKDYVLCITHRGFRIRVP